MKKKKNNAQNWRKRNALPQYRSAKAARNKINADKYR